MALIESTCPYNKLLILAIDELIESKVKACVLHVPGKVNDVADALSHFNNELALRLVLRLTILSFQLPHDMLGAAKK